MELFKIYIFYEDFDFLYFLKDFTIELTIFRRGIGYTLEIQQSTLLFSEYILYPEHMNI